MSAITRNIGNLHSQGNTQQDKSPIVKGNKENLKKKHGGNPHELSLSNLKESKERGTTSRKFIITQPLPSAVPRSHQQKGNKIQQPTALPEVPNPQDTKNPHKQFHKEDGMAIKNAETAKERNKQYPKPTPNQ